MSKWRWLPTGDNGGLDGSAYAKLFKSSEHHSAADLLAREVIQNSWDAATSLRTSTGNPKLDFSVHFKFIELDGEAKKKFIEAANLSAHSDRVQYLARSQSTDSMAQTLTEIFSEKPLRLLFCIDKGGHGFFGHPREKSSSILFRALYVLGGTRKNIGESSGGSFGFGKSAFIRGSKIRTVFAYSSFAPLLNDPVTRRLVGFSWWESHSSDSDEYEGRAMFGELKRGPNTGSDTVPFEDHIADQMAQELLFEARNALTPEEYGASLLLVEPTMTAEELRESVERYWWPALEERSLNFSVRITNEGGENVTPRPRQNPYVKTFIPMYELAIGQNKPSAILSEMVFHIKSHREGNLGTVAFRVMDIQEENDIEGDERETPQCEVALIRMPRMVLEYKKLGSKRIPFRGVFVANAGVDNFLRETENAEHNTWSMKTDADVSAEATEVATKVHRGISKHAATFQAEVSPPPPRENAFLPYFSAILSPFLKGTMVGPPRPPIQSVEPIEIRFVEGPQPATHGDGLLVTRARVAIRLADKSKFDSTESKLRVVFKIIENDGSGGDDWPIDAKPVSKSLGVVPSEEGFWSGPLDKKLGWEFDLVSEPYDDNWTGLLQVLIETSEDVGEK